MILHQEGDDDDDSRTNNTPLWRESTNQSINPFPLERFLDVRRVTGQRRLGPMTIMPISVV